MNVRAKVYRLPVKMNSLVAEFFGLMVADGTIYQSGFRLTKSHEDVVDRFEGLCIALFSVKTKRFMHGNAFACEVNSTYIRAWLECVGGLAAKQKRIPAGVLRSSKESTQSAFLCGLFEDGTVNIKKGRLDHVGFTTAYEDMARTVQLMLLRLGIISSVIETVSRGNHHWRVSVYGYNATLFADRIGFISAVKNAQLRTPAGPENRYLIPVDGSTVGEVEGKPWVRRNALNRGYVSRDAARQLGMLDELKFHHERIESITKGGDA
jgi:intein/homing endonuclease